MSLPDTMASLRGRFLARAADDRAALADHLDGLRRLDAITLRFTVHRLAGAAGTFGYAEVSDAAGEAEDDLLERPDAAAVSLRRLVDFLDACLLTDG